MKKNLLRSFLTLTLSFLFSFSFAQPGTLDSSFGVNGRVTNSFGLYGGELSDIAIQADGKIVGAGTYDKDYNVYGFLTVRFKSNGSIDSSFGDNGKVITYADTLPWLGIRATTVIIQPDGKILVGGTKSEIGVADGNFAMARYLTNGRPDSSFGINGLVITDVDPNFGPEAGITSLALQPDGKILAGGFSDGHCLIRYRSNGTVDSSFGINGKAQHEGGFDNINDIALQSDGKIVTAGESPWSNGGEATLYQIKISRFKSNGVLDSSFGNNGEVLFSPISDWDAATSIKIIENNKVLISGYASLNKYVLILIRLNSNGTFDTSFGSNGSIINNDVFLSSYYGSKLVTQPGGKFFATAGETNFQLYRFNNNGIVDSSFGINGAATANFVSTAVARSARLQTDGKIVVGGTPSISIARFKGDTPITVSLTKNISVTEGNTGITTPATFTLTLNKAATKQVKVNYHTRNLSAKSGSDYVSKSGTIAFGIGVTSKTVTINVKGDDVVEKNERFAFVITDPTNAVLGTDSVICIIKNDDLSFAKATDEDAIKATAIKLYPNPVKDVLRLEGLNANTKTIISIIDAEGKIIAITTTTANSVQQNIKQLSPGTYFVKIESNNKTETFKFIKQ